VAPNPLVSFQEVFMLSDPKKPERLTVAERTYDLKRPSVAERTQWRRACALAGARRHDVLDLLDAMKDGVVRLMCGTEQSVTEAVISKVETHRANVRAYRLGLATGIYVVPDDASPEDKETARKIRAADLEAMAASERSLAAIEAEVRQNYAPFAAKQADNAVYYDILGSEAARLFLVGWGVVDGAVNPWPGPPQRDELGLSEASLAAVPETHLPHIGIAMEAMARLSEAQRKNSSSPARAPSAGETSGA
jgi:hypothetical protein